MIVKWSTRTSAVASDDDIVLQFNGDSVSGHYAYKTLFGNGSSAGSGGNASAPFGYVGRANGSTSTASTFNNGEIYIPNYAGSNQKSFSVDEVKELNGTSGYQDLFANLWNQTSAITSIKIYSNSASSFVQYSSATLYGIKNS